MESGYIHHGEAPPIDVSEEEKLCRLVSEFGILCEKRKLRVNVCNSKVMRCSRYGNWDQMHVILNGEPRKWIDLSTWGRKWQPMEDVVPRMDEGY